MERIIAKEPILHSNRMFCPNCGRNLPLIRRYNYCPECGQAISYDGIYQNWDTRYKRPRVLFDMDDCINNFMGYLIEKHNERYGTNIKVTDVKKWDVDSVLPHGHEIFMEAGFFENIPVKNNSVASLKRMIKSTKYDIYIITACNSNRELEEKYIWFDKYLPDFNKDRIIKCKEKELIRGDVLIDDKVDNLDKCSPFMHCILFDMPSNKDCNEYPRVKNLKEVEKILEKMFYE